MDWFGPVVFETGIAVLTLLVLFGVCDRVGTLILFDNALIHACDGAATRTMLNVDGLGPG